MGGTIGGWAGNSGTLFCKYVKNFTATINAYLIVGPVAAVPSFDFWQPRNWNRINLYELLLF